MFSRQITATGAALAVAIGALAAPATWADGSPSPGAMGAGATAVSSRSLIPETPSPGASGGGATVVESQSLLPGYYRAGEHTGGPAGSPTLSVVHVTHASGFDWADAGLGAGTAIALGLAAAGSMFLVVRRRSLAG